LCKLKFNLARHDTLSSPCLTRRN